MSVAIDGRRANGKGTRVEAVTKKRVQCLRIGVNEPFERELR